MKKILLICSFLTLTIILMSAGCGGPKGTMKGAREATEKKEYSIAREQYQAVYSTTKNKEEKNEACFQVAESYYMANDMKNAESWYSKTIKADPKNTEAQYKYALTLKANGKYNESIAAFNTYKKSVPGDAAKVDEQIKGIELALKWKNEKTRYMVENVKGLNTKWSDFAPMYFKKDQIYFTSDREKGANNKPYGWTSNFHTDIYRVTYKIDKKNINNIKYDVPVLLDKNNINTAYNDGTAAFDSKGTVMYYTQCNGKDGKGKFCNIYMTTLSGQVWGEPKMLEIFNDSFNTGHPSLTKDNQIMFFSSDMPGSIGGKDIWFMTYSKRSKTWSDPVNLGPTVNTEKDEVYPFIHEDGTLYFSSNGHIGMGGMDIYYTTGSGTDWSTPINMKSPINSSGDDFSIIVSKDKESGYFSSTNREGGRGQDDIYRFYMTPLVFTLSGVARDVKTNAVLANTSIYLTTSTDTGKIVIKTDAAGSYKVDLKPKQDVELIGSHEDYLDSKIEFQTTKNLEVSTDLVQDLYLEPFDYEKAFTVDGILYDLNRAEIRPDAAKVLDSLVITLKHYPKIRIELGSHTDCRADSLYNMDLSQRRADSAVAYIIRQGIDSARLTAKGYGESLLANDCQCEGSYVKRQCTEEEHQMNRRTTVRVVANDYKPAKKEEPKVEQQQQKGQARPGTRPGTNQPQRR
jgi:peptidoglycan-associated lipoprotein